MSRGAAARVGAGAAARARTQGRTTAGAHARRGAGWLVGTFRATLSDARWDGGDEPEPPVREIDEDDAPDPDLTSDPWADEDEDWDEPGELDGAAIPAGLPEIQLWPHGTDVRVKVRPPSLTVMADPRLAPLAAARYRRLGGYAALLRDTYRAAILAPTLAAAFDTLPLADKGHMAELSGVTASQRARDRSVLVTIPAGTVPLDFFAWRSRADDIVRALAANPGLATASVDGPGGLAMQVQAELAGKGRSVTPAAVRPHVGWLRAVQQHPEPVRVARSRAATHPELMVDLIDELAAELAAAVDAARHAGTARGATLKTDRQRHLPVLRRAILGAMPWSL